MSNQQAAEILEFWLAAGPSAWWRKNNKFDEEIRTRFGDLLEPAAAGDFDDWRNEAPSCLALVLVLDQFSRNLYRGSAKTFAQDEYALELAKHAVTMGFNGHQPRALYEFFYLPYMHSEKLADQEACIELIRAGGEEGSLKAAIEHRDIIARFGRFPHRNGVLGRNTSAEEQAFLDGGGFSG